MQTNSLNADKINRALYEREFENKRVEFGMENEVIDEQNHKPLNIRHTVVDVTDERNDYLLHKLKFNKELTNNGPVVLVTRKGSGYINWGPTILHRVAEVIEMIQAQAAEENEKKSE